MGMLKGILEKLSKGSDTSTEKEFELIGNCFTFLGTKEGLGVSSFVLELAMITSQKGINTCIIDANPMSSFYIAKFCDNLTEDIPSLEKRFVKASTPLVECLLPVNDNLRVLTFGNIQLSSTFDMPYETIEKAYKDVKALFDLVLIDATNLPWVESCLIGVDVGSTVYSCLDCSIDSVYSYVKMENLFRISGNDFKLKNLIIFNVPKNTSITKDLLPVLDDVTIVTEVPYIPGYSLRALQETSVLNSLTAKESKEYVDCLNILFKEITEGIAGKEVDDHADNKGLQKQEHGDD